MMFSDRQLQELWDKILKSRFISVNTSGGRNNQQIWVNLNGRRIQARCFGDVPSGECLAVQLDTKEWLLVKAQVADIPQESIRNLELRRTKSKEKVEYNIATLLLAYLPPAVNAEYWATGGRRNKRFNDLDVPLNNNVSLDGKDGYLMNLGKGYLIAVSNSAQVINYDSISNRSYAPQNINNVINGQLTAFTANFYASGESYNFSRPLCYLGNGVWQSPIENGIGRIIANIGNGKLIFGARMVGNFPSYQGISRVAQFAGDTVTVRIDANILPDDKNFVIHDGILEELPGSLSINVVGISALDTTDILFGLRERAIAHQTYTPYGYKNFNYISTLSGVTEEYIYIESQSGEVLVIAWGKQYITHIFDIEKQSKYTSSSSGYTLSESITQSTQSLTLRYYDDPEQSKAIALNCNDKFLSLQSSVLNSETLDIESLTLESESFAMQLGAFDYSKVNPTFDLSAYVGENYLFCQVINNKPYLIKGTIYFAALLGSRPTFKFSISDFIVLPSLKYKSNGDEYRTINYLPFYQLILDNGCFWNYYLTGFIVSRGGDVSTGIAYPYLIFQENSSSDQWKFEYGAITRKFELLCDQTLQFINTNPVTRYCMQFNFYQNLILSETLLLTDNLVNNKIYRVVESQFLQEFTRRDFIYMTKIPIAEWVISSDGNIKYNRTFLTNYRIRYPYYDRQTEELTAEGISIQSHSYRNNRV